ncbi:single-stranded DNA-binding protein [Pseudonocardia abyssalis]|uniref:Single-stranded DNA-binding protein n=1 Tax=Pseudonocardia abyssalis TaxID=2792008 RepID=A0ABS6URT4_9PSEU|nr:single-stranded DNA-binding protein [Pseudonocardia abyssalis]MBW0134973.1 single-stranded DNA-binding protein [Pseudonocardia abyssalis]
MNKLTIHGNITAKPELRFSRSGVPVATFTVATNRRRLNRQTGTWTDLPSVFHRVVCFNALAENVATSLTKGATVAVTGEFADDTYKREDGTTVRRTQIEAADVAASLRYATATLTKTRRTTSNPTGPEDRDDETTQSLDAERPELTVVGSD